MNTEMSEMTRQEVLARKRERYARAGKEHKGKIIAELVELFGYHPKAAIRALRPRVIRPAPLQPCGERLKACLPEWLPAYEADRRQLDADVQIGRAHI